jgi:hypothetical protein
MKPLGATEARKKWRLRTSSVVAVSAAAKAMRAPARTRRANFLIFDARCVIEYGIRLP